MNFATWAPLLALAVIVTAATVVHALTHDLEYMPRWAWVLLVIFTIPFGTIVYFVVYFGGHNQRPDAEGRR